MIILKRKTIIIAFLACSSFTFIAGCGTLGGIGDTIYFSTSKKKLEIAIDSLYSLHPDYKMPEKWKKFDDWSATGYDFLESRIFYFRSPPEEMYYVTFIGDSVALQNPTWIGTGIRAMNRGYGKWNLEVDLNSKQKERIKNALMMKLFQNLKSILKQQR